MKNGVSDSSLVSIILRIPGCCSFPNAAISVLNLESRSLFFKRLRTYRVRSGPPERRTVYVHPCPPSPRDSTIVQRTGGQSEVFFDARFGVCCEVVFSGFGASSTVVCAWTYSSHTALGSTVKMWSLILKETNSVASSFI